MLFRSEDKEESVAVREAECLAGYSPIDSNERSHRRSCRSRLSAVPRSTLARCIPGHCPKRRKWRNECVAPPRLNVSLPHETRRACHCRGDQHGDCDVSTCREDDIWLDAPNHLNHLWNRAQKAQPVSQGGKWTSSSWAQARRSKQRQRVALCWDEARLDAALATDPVDLSVGMETTERTSDSEPGEQVPPGSTARDQNAHRSLLALTPPSSHVKPTRGAQLLRVAR